MLRFRLYRTCKVITCFVSGLTKKSNTLKRPYKRTNYLHRRSIFTSNQTVKMSSSDINFDSMNVDQLCDFLESKGLPKSGNQIALIERAKTYWNHSHKTAGNLDSNDTAAKNELDIDPAAIKTEQEFEQDRNITVKEEAQEPGEEIQQQQQENELKLLGTNEYDTLDVDGLAAENGKKRPQETPLRFTNTKRQKMLPILKTPVQILNERIKGLQYEIIQQTGTPDKPVFKMGVMFQGKCFVADGTSKKQAKHLVAAEVLRFLDPIGPGPPPNFLVQREIDFTSDSPLWNNGEHFHDVQQIADEVMTDTPQFISSDDCDNLEKTQAKILAKSPQGAHPVMLLNSLFPGLEYQRCEEHNTKIITMRTSIKGVEYKGDGRNKKSAKMAVAIKALREVFGIVTRKLPDQLPIAGSENKTNTTIPADAGRLPDLIRGLVREKFSSLTDNFESPNAKRKVLAGVVMTTENGPHVENGEVICIATGTKCISGEHMSSTGTALNDCHAEIICRRGLRRFLYLQLLLHASNKEESIFEPCENVENAGYRLKSNVYFHLFISTSPCGDSRIFSPHETERQSDDHPNRKARGQLRTKIEAGEGTIPVQDNASLDNEGAQPWDAVIAGERLLTMSCSDKLARWNVLGIQGSLLSLYTEPVYFSSMILGSLYHSEHFSRGVYSRVKEAVGVAPILSSDAKDDKIKDEEMEVSEQILKEPFKLHRPLLASVTNPEHRRAAKAPSFCFHWTICDEDSSVINTVTGKGDGAKPSNLCKMEMFKMLRELMSTDLKPKVSLPEKADELSYGEMKNLATDYQELKRNLHAGFKAAGMGIWVKKPDEVDGFVRVTKKMEYNE